MHITPKIADALRVLAGSTSGTLVRCSGGYRALDPIQTPTPVVTRRTVRAMDRAWLVRMLGDFDSGAELTDKGRAALEQLRAQDAATAARAG